MDFPSGWNLKDRSVSKTWTLKKVILNQTATSLEIESFIGLEILMFVPKKGTKQTLDSQLYIDGTHSFGLYRSSCSGYQTEQLYLQYSLVTCS